MYGKKERIDLLSDLCVLKRSGREKRYAVTLCTLRRSTAF